MECAKISDKVLQLPESRSPPPETDSGLSGLTEALLVELRILKEASAAVIQSNLKARIPLVADEASTMTVLATADSVADWRRASNNAQVVLPAAANDTHEVVEATARTDCVLRSLISSSSSSSLPRGGFSA